MSLSPHGSGPGDQQWGSGIPGIPSVWDSPHEGGAQPVWLPPTAPGRRTSSGSQTRSARRWATEVRPAASRHEQGRLVVDVTLQAVQGRLVFETASQDAGQAAVLAAVGVRTVAGWVLPPG